MHQNVFKPISVGGDEAKKVSVIFFNLRLRAEVKISPFAGVNRPQPFSYPKLNPPLTVAKLSPTHAGRIQS